MVKSVIGVLLAASALAPGIASAQQEVRGDVQVDAQRQDNRAQRDAYRAQRQQDRAQQGQGQQRPPAQQGQVQAQAQGGAQFRQGDPRQGGYQPQQGDRGQYQQGRYQQGRFQNGQRPDFGPNAPGGQGGYAGRGDPNGQRPNFGPNAPGGQGGYAGRGPDADRGGYDGRGGAYAGQRGGYDGGRGYQNRGPDRGGWNNGWRGDQRYDWNRYRYQNRDAFHLPRYYAPANWGYGYRRFSVGVTLGYGFYGQNYWIADPYDYRLPPAYGPYRWVRYYNDALLVDVRSGYVVDAVYGIFW